MSVIRLVILGALRQIQPAHGYSLRQELMSWHVDEWASVRAGSIYSALRMLEAEGFIEHVGTFSENNRPAKTTYALTAAGDAEYMRLLRAALWNLEQFDMQPITAVASFLGTLSRQEVLAGMHNRIEQIDAAIAANDREIELSARTPKVPAHVAEVYELTNERLLAERRWAERLVQRVEAGTYRFADDEDLDAHSG